MLSAEIFVWRFEGYKQSYRRQAKLAAGYPRSVSNTHHWNTVEKENHQSDPDGRKHRQVSSHTQPKSMLHV